MTTPNDNNPPSPRSSQESLVRPEKRFRVEIVIDACDIEEAQWRIEDLLDRQENLSARETITGDGWIKIIKREHGYDEEPDYRQAFSEYRKEIRRRLEECEKVNALPSQNS